MRKFGFILGVIAAIAMVIAPVAPSYASTADGKSIPKSHKIVRGELFLLPAQLEDIAYFRPALHQAILKAQETGKPPVLSVSDSRLIQKMSNDALNEIKAGGALAAALLTIAVSLVVYYIQNRNNPTGAKDFGGFVGSIACALGALFGLTCGVFVTPRGQG